MKKFLKNLLLSLMVIIPFNAAALTYTLGNPQDAGTPGTTYINIIVYGTDGTVKQTDILTCSATNGVDCSIEALSGCTKQGDIIASNEPFTEGKAVGRLVLKNSKYEEVNTSVVFQQQGADPKATNVTVGAADKPLSDDATIHKLSINVGEIDPAFKSDVDTYVIYGVSDTHRRIKFTYECDNCNVNFEGGASTNGSEVELNTGENTVKAVVRSQDTNNTKTYTFTVIRGTTAYNSSKLKSLTIGEYEVSPKFDKETLEYEVKVPKKISNIENILKYEAEDVGAKVTVEGANKLDNDENTVVLTVYSRDGSKTEYKIKVVKEDVEEIIEVIGYKDKKVTYMNVEGVREELSEEEFKTKFPNDWAKIEDETYKFDENGNIIKEQQANEEPKKEEKKNSFPWLIVVLIVLAIIIIAVAGFFIFRDPDKKDGKNDKKGKGEKDKDVEDVEEIVPTEEEQEHLDDIDSYNEEARLIAENNINEDKEEKTEEVVEEKEETKKDEEVVVKEETIDDYKDEEKSPTMDIDEALSDLMNTKEYNFKD